MLLIWQFCWLMEFSISIYLNDLYYHVFLFNSLKKFAKRTVCDSLHQELMNHQQSATGMTYIFHYSLVIGCPHHCRVCSPLLLDPWIFTTRSVCKFKFASEPEFFGFLWQVLFADYSPFFFSAMIFGCPFLTFSIF